MSLNPTTSHGGSSSGGSDFAKTTVTLSNAQLLALNVTPVTLVAAQGAGTIVLPVWVYSRLTAPTPTFPQAQVTVGYAAAGIGLWGLASSFTGRSANGVNLVVTPGDVTAANASDLVNAPVSAFATTTLNAGAILTSVLVAGGSGYGAGNALTVLGGNSDAVGVIDTVDGSGAILTYHLTNGGTGYTTTNNPVTLSDGMAGNDGTANVTAITPPTGGQLIMETFYTVIAV